MWSTFNALPVLPKFLLVCLVLGLIYKMTDSGRGGNSGSPVPSLVGEQGKNIPDGTSQALLAKYQPEQSQLVAVMAECKEQISQNLQKMAIASANGTMVAPCPSEQDMPQWIAREAFLEGQIYRLQTGDTQTALRKIVGISGHNR
jgi:hypothetical protein